MTQITKGGRGEQEDLWFISGITKMSETNELAQKLARRNQINEGEDVPRKQLEVFNPYTEFKEFSRKQIKDFEKMFKK